MHGVTPPLADICLAWHLEKQQKRLYLLLLAYKTLSSVEYRHLKSLIITND
jgi:hypothetical protein